MQTVCNKNLNLNQEKARDMPPQKKGNGGQTRPKFWVYLHLQLRHLRALI